MKKFLTICFMTIMMCVNVNAQNEWVSNYHEGDELKGIEEYYSNYYRNENGEYFVCWDNSDEVKIGIRNDIFDCRLSTYDYRTYTVYVIVGFYKDGKLIKKETTHFDVPHDNFTIAFSSRKIGKKIIKHLKETGDVRIITHRYGNSDFDILLPMNKYLK